MATWAATYKRSLSANQTPAGDYDGGATAASSTDLQLGSGTTSYAFNKLFRDVRALGTTNEDVDLRAMTDAFGTTLTFVEVRYFEISCPSSNATVFQVKPSAANGWAGANAPWQDASDIINVYPGCRVIFEMFADGMYLMDATHKSINVANAGATGSYTIILLGTSA